MIFKRLHSFLDLTLLNQVFIFADIPTCFAVIERFSLHSIFFKRFSLMGLDHFFKEVLKRHGLHYIVICA